MNLRLPNFNMQGSANSYSLDIMLGSLIVIATAMTTFAGCSMCCGTHDNDYPVMGGLMQRADPQRGRVGSVFSDPYAGFYGPSADSNLQPIEPQTPTDLDSDELSKKNLELEPQPDEDMMDRLNTNPRPDTDELKPPVPDDDSNSARHWRNRPLRSTQQWR